MQHLTVAVVQLTSTTDVTDNLKQAEHWIRQAAAMGAQFVTLPENFGFLGADREVVQFAQSVDDGPFTAPLRQLARQLNIYVLAGSIPEAGPDAQHVYNTSVLIGPDGHTAASYRKIHLFDVTLGHDTQFTESAAVAPGHTVVTCDVHGWRVGLSVCYDLRFPELYRALIDQGAQLLTVPAAFTLHTGKDHWDVLLRARAIENQCYVLAPAQFGRHSAARQTWGKSLVIDPWGTALCTAPERPGVTLAVCDADFAASIRKNLPSLHNRRLPGFAAPRV